jgi:hypothetical protein
VCSVRCSRIGCRMTSHLPSDHHGTPLAGGGSPIQVSRYPSSAFSVLSAPHRHSGGGTVQKGICIMPHFLVSYGLLAIFVLITAESACVPVPSEVTMLLGGAISAGAVSGSHPTLAAAIVSGTAGNLAGSYLAWWAGRRWGQPVLHRRGRYAGLRPRELARARTKLNPAGARSRKPLLRSQWRSAGRGS